MEPGEEVGSLVVFGIPLTVEAWFTHLYIRGSSNGWEILVGKATLRWKGSAYHRPSGTSVRVDNLRSRNAALAALDLKLRALHESLTAVALIAAQLQKGADDAAR